MNISVNGDIFEVDEGGQITYERLRWLGGYSEDRYPSIMYLTKDDRSGMLIPGDVLVIDQPVKFDVMVTGNS